MERQLCDDVVELLLQKSSKHYVAMEKILTTFPEAVNTIDIHMIKRDYKDLCMNHMYGIVYAKWIKTNILPTVSLLIDATILNHVETFRVYDRYFHNQISRHYGYIHVVERCTSLAISFDHVDILRYLYIERNLPFPEHLVYNAYVHGSELICLFLYETLKISPSPQVFYDMICLNPEVDFTPYIPKGLKISTVLLSYGMYHDRHPIVEDSVSKLLSNADKDDISFTLEELSMYKHYCEMNIPPARKQLLLHERTIQNIPEIPMWKVIKYLWDNFNTYPSTYDLQGLFSDLVYNKDIEGVQFLLETLGWIPNDIALFQDDIFSDKDFARYIIEYLDITDWEDLYEELYGWLY